MFNDARFRILRRHLHTPETFKHVKTIKAPRNSLYFGKKSPLPPDLRFVKPRPDPWAEYAFHSTNSAEATAKIIESFKNLSNLTDAEAHALEQKNNRLQAIAMIKFHS